MTVRCAAADLVAYDDLGSVVARLMAREAVERLIARPLWRRPTDDFGARQAVERWIANAVLGAA